MRQTKLGHMLADAFEKPFKSSQAIYSTDGAMHAAFLGSYKIRGLWTDFYKSPTQETWAAGRSYTNSQHMRQLKNNLRAVDTTYLEIKQFIDSDSTKLREYKSGMFVCGDFAEALHNKIEACGIRCGYVMLYRQFNPLIKLENEKPGHAINIFNTTDKGVIFADLTAPYVFRESEFFKLYKPKFVRMVILV